MTEMEFVLLYFLKDVHESASGVTILRHSDLRENFSVIRKSASDVEPVRRSVRTMRDSMTEGKPDLDKSEKCQLCGKCENFCPQGIREIVGREYPVKELVKELMKDRMFYEQSGGGVTLSGGEVMAMSTDYMLTDRESA